MKLPRAMKLPRFSLRTLLLVFALVALVASHVYTSMRLRDALQENRLLHQELDRFPVDDVQRLYAGAVTSLDKFTWRWRVYLPEGRRFVLRTANSQIPESGLATPPGWVGDELPNGELIVTVAAHKDQAGKWWIVTMMPVERSRFPVAANEATWLNTGQYSSRQGRPRRHRVFRRRQASAVAQRTGDDRQWRPVVG
jgi:hypothetical protein